MKSTTGLLYVLDQIDITSRLQRRWTMRLKHSPYFALLLLCLLCLYRSLTPSNSSSAPWHPPPATGHFRRNHSHCYKASESTIVFMHLSYESKHWRPLEMCAFKSAAVFNPNSRICVLTLIDMDADPRLKALPNLEVDQLNITELLEGTPLDYWYQTYASHKHRVSNVVMWDTSDALRFAYLYKYGGTYLDTDILTLKTLESLRNVLGFEDEEYINGAVMKFTKGHPLMKAALVNFLKHFKPGRFGSVGPKFITYLLQNQFVDSSTYSVLNSSAFYPVHYFSGGIVFNASAIESVKTSIKESYTLHLWRKLYPQHWRENGPNMNGSFVGRFLHDVCYR